VYALPANGEITSALLLAWIAKRKKSSEIKPTEKLVHLASRFTNECARGGPFD
jgi:hypothetical protein